MPLPDLMEVTRFGVPQPHGIVVAARRKQGRSWVPAHRHDDVVMPHQ